jgi:hypothetical protein
MEICSPNWVLEMKRVILTDVYWGDMKNIEERIQRMREIFELEVKGIQKSFIQICPECGSTLDIKHDY